MSYTILPDHLHATADAIGAYLVNTLGVTRVLVEQEIADNVGWRPTLSGMMPDRHTVCVEVTDGGYTQALDGAILQVISNAMPVKLFLGYPASEIKSEDFQRMFEGAHRLGAGIIAVNRSRCSVQRPAVSLSLIAVRRVETKEFSKSRRQAVNDAYETFVNGDPPKGCSRMYDEIEALTRKFAAKALAQGWWSTKIQKVAKKSWAIVLEDLFTNLNWNAVWTKCPQLTKPLMSTIIGLTPKRNDTGHRPSSQKSLCERDRQLRTRIEHAADVLLELDKAVRPLRI